MKEICATSARPSPRGHVSAHELYTLEEIDARLGLGEGALRTARKRGLKLRQIGRRKFVLGSDLIAYLRGKGVGVGWEARHNEASRPGGQTL